MKRLAVEIADALSLAARERDDIWVLDADLGDSYGLYDDAHRPRFARFLQTGIAEQTLVGAAAGLAAAGKLPWVFSFSAFLCHRAADQIRTCVAQPGLPVVFVGSHAGAATGTNGCSHASLADLGVLGAIGGIELWAPADATDVVAAVASLLATPRPAYLRTSREPCRF
jgi:transketolase